MTTDLSSGEVKGVKDLLSMGFSCDFVAHTVVMGRKVDMYTDVRVAVNEIAGDTWEE